MTLALVMAACEGGDTPNLSEGSGRATVMRTSVGAGGVHACRVITDGAGACRGEHRYGNLMPLAGKALGFGRMGCLFVLQVWQDDWPTTPL